METELPDLATELKRYNDWNDGMYARQVELAEQYDKDSRVQMRTDIYKMKNQIEDLQFWCFIGCSLAIVSYAFLIFKKD